MLRKLLRLVGLEYNLLSTSWEKIQEEDVKLQLEIDGQPVGIHWIGNVLIEENVYTGEHRGFFEDRMGNFKRIDDENLQDVLQWNE